MNDLDQSIRHALNADAARAPIPPAEWGGQTLATVAPQVNRRWVMRAGLLAAAAAATGAIVMYRGSNIERQQARGNPPAGVPEVLLADLGPMSSATGDIAVAGLTHRIGLEGHPDFSVYPAVQYRGGPSTEVMHMTMSGGGGSDQPQWMSAAPDLSITSTVDNNAGAFDAWTWSNVPASTAYVVFSEGSHRSWERPVAGFVAFPMEEHFSGGPGQSMIGIAYDADDHELQRADMNDSSTSDALQHVTPKYPDISQDQGGQLFSLNTATLTACLSRSGASWSADGTVAALPAGTDNQAVWNGCAQESIAAVAAKIAEWAPRFYDSENGERPLVANPFLQFSDPSDCTRTSATTTTCTPSTPPPSPPADPASTLA